MFRRNVALKPALYFIYTLKSQYFDVKGASSITATALSIFNIKISIF